MELQIHKIPAYLRLRSLKKKDEKKLLLTALDRKEAGVLLSVEKYPKPMVTALDREKAGLLKPKKRHYNFLEKLEAEAEREKKISTIYSRNQRPLTAITEPTPTTIKKVEIKKKEIGIITHYFDKIKVGVIKLSVGFSVGTMVMIGEKEQLIFSMQKNRKEIKRAKKGEEIGVKMEFQPQIGETVYKITR